MGKTAAGSLTQKEVASQPVIWNAVIRRLNQVSRLPVLQEFDQVLFIGCGSTHYLSQWAASRCRQIVQVRAAALPSSEFIFHPESWLLGAERTLLVAISRSAETSETLMALEAYSQLKAGESFLISCNPDPPPSVQVNWLLAIPEAQEESVAQTRSFTSMMLAVLRLLLGIIPEEVSRKLVEQGHLALEAGRSGVGKTIQAIDPKRFFFLGSGAREGLANEAMLKMKEMSLSHSEAFTFMEFRHGPKSVANEKSLAVSFLNEHPTIRAYELDVLSELRQLGSQVYVMHEEAGGLVLEDIEMTVSLGGGLQPPWTDPLFLLPAHQLALAQAQENGVDPDHPQNLSAVVVLDT